MSVLVLCHPWEVEEKVKAMSGRANQISYRLGIAHIGEYIVGLEARCELLEEKLAQLSQQVAELKKPPAVKPYNRV